VTPGDANETFLAHVHITKDIFNPAIRVQLALALVTRHERFAPFALLRVLFVLFGIFVLFAGHVEHCGGASFIANVLHCVER
jgi:hypothetical protein